MLLLKEDSSANAKQQISYNTYASTKEDPKHELSNILVELEVVQLSLDKIYYLGITYPHRSTLAPKKNRDLHYKTPPDGILKNFYKNKYIKRKEPYIKLRKI